MYLIQVSKFRFWSKFGKSSTRFWPRIRSLIILELQSPRQNLDPLYQFQIWLHLDALSMVMTAVVRHGFEKRGDPRDAYQKLNVYPSLWSVESRKKAKIGNEAKPKKYKQITLHCFGFMSRHPSRTLAALSSYQARNYGSKWWSQWILCCRILTWENLWWIFIIGSLLGRWRPNWGLFRDFHGIFSPEFDTCPHICTVCLAATLFQSFDTWYLPCNLETLQCKLCFCYKWICLFLGG